MKSHYYPLTTNSYQPRPSFATPLRPSTVFPTSERNVIRTKYEGPIQSPVLSQKVTMNNSSVIQPIRSTSQIISTSIPRESFTQQFPQVFDNVKPSIAVTRNATESGYIRRHDGSLTRVVRHPDSIEMTETRYNFVIPKSSDSEIKGRVSFTNEARTRQPSVTISRPQLNSSRILVNPPCEQMSRNPSDSKIIDSLNRIKRISVNEIVPTVIQNVNNFPQNITQVQEKSRADSVIRINRIAPDSNATLNEKVDSQKNTSIIRDYHVERPRTFTRFDLKTSIINTNRLAAILTETDKPSVTPMAKERTADGNKTEVATRPDISKIDPLDKPAISGKQVEVSAKDTSTVDESKDQKSQTSYRPFSFGDIQREEPVVSPVQNKTPKDSITVKDPNDFNDALRESIILSLPNKAEINEKPQQMSADEQPRKRASSVNSYIRGGCSVDLGKNIKDSKFMSNSMISLDQNFKKSILKKKGSCSDFKKKKVLINENDNTNHLVDKYLDKNVPDEEEAPAPSTFRQVIRLSQPTQNLATPIRSYGLPVSNLSNISYMHPIKVPLQTQVPAQPRVVYSVLRDSTNLSDHPYSYRR